MAGPGAGSTPRSELGACRRGATEHADSRTCYSIQLKASLLKASRLEKAVISRR